MHLFARLSLLGSPRLIDHNGCHVRLPARAFALTAVIALSRERMVERAVLANLLWGDSPTRFGSLRKLLWSLREATGQAGIGVIEADDTSVRLVQHGLSVDVFGIADLERGRGALSLGELCRIYRGDLLDGLDLKSSNWNEWLQIHRAKLRTLFIEAISIDIETSLDGSQIKLAARRLLEIDAYNETACRRLIKIHLQEGEQAQARRIYQDLVQRLRFDLETEPTAETKRLIEPMLTRGDMLPGRHGSEAAPAPMEPLPVLAKAGVPTICLLMPAGAGRTGKLDLIAQSLIDDVTIGLCRTRILRVLAPHTAWKISDINTRDHSLLSLGVDYAVETKVQKIGDAARLTMKMFRVSTREIIWAEHFSFEPLDVAQLYHDLSLRILSGLLNHVERVELGRYANTRDPNAYICYLRGKRHLAQLDLPNIRRGRQALKSALAASPTFVPALSAMARSYNLEWLLLARGEDEILSRAEDLAKRAIAIDGQDSSGFRELAACNLYLRRYDESLQAYASAEALHPQHADLMADFADALVHSSEIPRALEKVHQAIDLNPLCPDRYLWAEAGAHYFLENYLTAIELLKKMQNPNPALRLLAAAHAMAGQHDEAMACVEQALDINPDFQVSRWMEIVPTRRKAQLRHYEYGLRAAGFQ
jgi:DNA-binding SARP family transcriptional activator/TolB-like protein